MKKIAALALVSAVALAACNKSSSHDESAAPPAAAPAPAPATAASAVVKNDLHAEALKARPLSDSDKAAIRALSLKGVNFPGESLWVPGTDQSDDAKEMAELSAKGQAMLKRIKADCEADGGKDVKVGNDRDFTVTREKSVTGRRCPVRYGVKETKRTIITAYDPASQKMSYTETEDSKSQKQVVDKNLAADLVYVAVIQNSHSVTTGIDAVSVKGEVKAGSISKSAETKFSSQISANLKLSGSAKLEGMLIPGSTAIQLVETLDFSDGKKVVIAGFQHDGVTDFFLNGVPTTAEKIKAEIGVDFRLK